MIRLRKDHAMTHTIQPADHFVTLNGLKIHYREWSNGDAAGKPPFILLHGIARVARCFDHLAPQLANDYRVIAVDMRGHGESDWHPDGAYLVEDYTTDIEALIDQLDLRDIRLWGASTGGRVAQMTAVRRADRVKAVIVEDVGPERPTAVSNRRGGRMAREAEEKAELQARLEEEFEEKLVEAGSEINEELTSKVDSYLDYVVEHDGLEKRSCLPRHAHRTRLPAGLHFGLPIPSGFLCNSDQSEFQSKSRLKIPICRRSWWPRWKQVFPFTDHQPACCHRYRLGVSRASGRAGSVSSLP